MPLENDLRISIIPRLHLLVTCKRGLLTLDLKLRSPIRSQNCSLMPHPASVVHCGASYTEWFRYLTSLGPGFASFYQVFLPFADGVAGYGLLPYYVTGSLKGLSVCAPSRYIRATKRPISDTSDFRTTRA